MNNMFKLICIEGADKSGKTVLSNTIRKMVDVDYIHLTIMNKKHFEMTDYALLSNVNVSYQAFNFFNKNIFNRTKSKTVLLDRTPIYSDMVYGQLYKKHNQDIFVRDLERDFFTKIFQSLDCIFIYANNYDLDYSYDEIVKENEQWIESKNEYIKLREKYDEVMSDVKSKINKNNFIEYDFNKYDGKCEEFVSDIILPKLKKQNHILDELFRNEALGGQVIGNLNNFDKVYYVDDISGELPIYIQDYANYIMNCEHNNIIESKFKGIDYKYNQKPKTYYNDLIIREGSTAEFILKHLKIL